jgi:hypothetical protein
MNLTSCQKIKGRSTANDVFITPIEVAKQQINLHNINEGELWLDPCRNNEEGSYYKNFPNGVSKDWCEIIENKDFFEYNYKPDVICANPPYSIIDKWIQKTLELCPREFSLLIGIGNLTTKRIELIENCGYGISKIKMLKINKLYGLSSIILFEKNKKSIIEYDRKVYRV